MVVNSSNLIVKGIQQTPVYVVVCLVGANVECLRENTGFLFSEMFFFICRLHLSAALELNSR